MKAVIYSRVSSDNQDVDLSISAQIRDLREYAKKQGYEIIREFVDEAESGRTADRPAFKEMIALAKMRPPPFDAILVWKLDRFARNRFDSATYKTLLRSRGIKVISIKEPFDEGPSGQLLEGMIECFDEFYSANLGQDVKRGLRESARRGFYNSSKPPYGFHKVAVKDGEKNRWKLEPDESSSASRQTVERIFDLAVKDIGCKEIAKILNREDIRTDRGERWGKTTVHKILNNEAYCGTLVFGGRPGHKAIHSGDPPVRVENAWPSIINKDIFNSIQARMSSKRPQEIHPRIVPSFYLLSGLLHCSCGSAMIGRSAKSHQFYYYSCNRGYKQGEDVCNAKSWPKEMLERIVVDQVKEKVLNDEWLEELVELTNKELDSSHGAIDQRKEGVDKELREVGNRLLKLYDALETDKLSLDDVAPRIKELRNRQNELSKTSLQLEAEKLTQGPQHLDPAEIKKYAEELKETLDNANVVESKAFLRSFIERIDINADQGVIHYRLPMPQGQQSERLVLPMVTPGGPKETFAKSIDTFFEVTIGSTPSPFGERSYEFKR